MFLENTINHAKQSGWMEVICGSMFSGKTEELIRRLHRAEMAGQQVEIFKPKLMFVTPMKISFRITIIRSEYSC